MTKYIHIFKRALQDFLITVFKRLQSLFFATKLLVWDWPSHKFNFDYLRENQILGFLALNNKIGTVMAIIF